MITIELIVFAITIILVVAIGSYSFYKVGIQLTDKAKSQVKQELSDKRDWVKSMRHDAELSMLLWKIKEQLNANYICLLRLHNGGFFNNGLTKKYFSIVQEFNDNEDDDIMGQYQFVFTSRYAPSMLNLISHEEFHVTDMEFCADRNLKRDCKKHGIESLYWVGVFQIDEHNTPEAILGVCYNKPKNLEKEKRDLIKSYHNEILKHINQQRDLYEK